MAQASTEWHRCWTGGRRNQHNSQSQGWWTQKPAKLRQRRGKELGEELPSVAEEDAELHHQCFRRSAGTARVGSNNSSAHHSSTRRTTIRLRSRSQRSSDGPGRQKHQVFAVLMEMAEGEANDIVCNSSGMGLEAWRKLTRRWNPLAGSRLRSLLKLVISPGRASFTELPGALERWRNRFRSTGILRTNTDRVETYQRTS